MVSVLLISSLIVVFTSLMMPAGVDAPAVSPAIRQPAKSAAESSSAPSIERTREQLCRQISARCFVLALFRSPTTTITSTFAAISAASF